MQTIEGVKVSGMFAYMPGRSEPKDSLDAHNDAEHWCRMPLLPKRAGQGVKATALLR